MKRVLLGVLALFSIAVLTSCALIPFGPPGIFFDDSNSQADARMEQIADAVNSHDAAALKAMFSTRALEDATDLDKRLDYLLSFFPNGGLTWERVLARSSGHNTGGKKTELIHARYKVSTDGKDFRLYFTDFTINEVEDTENVGLYGLGVTPWTESTEFGPAEPFAAWDGSIDIDGNGKRGYPGVYIPPENDKLSVLTMEWIVGEINSKDDLGLRHEFTEYAQNKHVTQIDKGIDELYSLFPLHDAAWDETQQPTLVVRESSGTLLLLSTYHVTSAKGDFRLFFADFRENAADPSNLGVFAIGVAPWTEAGDSAAEVALAAWADTFDVDATVPPGIFISQ